jgi:ubiquinone/menaquinone biosynthesis C-methylase UbiE
LANADAVIKWTTAITAGTMEDVVRLYSGSVPALYDHYRGPVFFEPYARDLAGRLQHVAQGSVLEIAAGTGIVTRILAARLPPQVTIVASDLSPAMLDFAMAQSGVERVAWRQADALALPFPDSAFDAVLCQFGAMFFQDKVAGYREAFRVLKPSSRFVFNVWDRIEENEFCCVVNKAVGKLFPGDTPELMERTAYGYCDTAKITQELSVAGFNAISMETVERLSHAASAHDLAVGFCQGSPLRSEIEARAATRLAEATEAATEALIARFGPGPMVGKMRAHVFTATKK